MSDGVDISPHKCGFYFFVRSDGFLYGSVVRMFLKECDCSVIVVCIGKDLRVGKKLFYAGSRLIEDDFGCSPGCSL